MEEILDRQDERVPGTGFEQYQLELPRPASRWRCPAL
jgi:hypothetical protein